MFILLVCLFSFVLQIPLVDAGRESSNRGIVYDQKQQILYCTITQLFSIWFVPFYKSHVKLVTVLHLKHEGDKYYIESQEDLYQINELVKFFWPGGATILTVLQWIATVNCVIAALLLAPFTWVEQGVANNKARKIR